MLRKFSFFKIAPILLVLIFVPLFLTQAQTNETESSAVLDFSVGLAFSDSGCTAQFGGIQYTPYVSSISGTNGEAMFAVDGDSITPDCARLVISRSRGVGDTTRVTKDFRVCIEMVNDPIKNWSGGYSYTGATGKKCTGWASEGWSNSAWSTNTQKFDPDGGVISVETKPFPEAGMEISNFRIGIQASDNACNSEFGQTQWSHWFNSGPNDSLGRAYTSWATDGSDAVNPDCYRLHLHTETNNICRTYDSGDHFLPWGGEGNAFCQRFGQYTEEYIAESETKGADLCFKNYGTADRICPNSNGVITGVLSNVKGDRYLMWARCEASENLIKQPRALARVPELPGEMDTELACNTRGCAGLYLCPSNTVMVGTKFWNPPGSGNDDYSQNIFCAQTEENVVIDYSREILISNSGDCGQGDTCQQYGNLASSNPNYESGDEWVAIGAGFNADSNNKYIKGIMYAPIKRNPPSIYYCGPGEDPVDDPGLPPECSDGIDNDNDDQIDFPQDDSCASPEDNSESIPGEQGEEGEPTEPTVNECEDGKDNDHDGYVDGDDPGCANGQELDSISCGFSANPTVVAIGIGTSQLSWSCKHSDGTTQIHPSLRVVVEDNDDNKDFPDLAGTESRQGTANVSPVRNTIFYLEIFGVNFAENDPEEGEAIHTESAEVKVSTTTFDEIIP